MTELPRDLLPAGLDTNVVAGEPLKAGAFVAARIAEDGTTTIVNVGAGASLADFVAGALGSDAEDA